MKHRPTVEMIGALSRAVTAYREMEAAADELERLEQFYTTDVPEGAIAVARRRADLTTRQMSLRAEELDAVVLEYAAAIREEAP